MNWKAAIVLGVVVSLALWALASGANRQAAAVVVLIGRPIGQPIVYRSGGWSRHGWRICHKGRELTLDQLI